MTIQNLIDKYQEKSDRAYESARLVHPADAAMWRSAGQIYSAFVNDLKELAGS